jgi:hypothetical protein
MALLMKKVEINGRGWYRSMIFAMISQIIDEN